MLAVRYTYGTPCDISSNQPRETVVYYGRGTLLEEIERDTQSFTSFDLVCDERGNDGILNFEEISSCYYEMTVASRWLCKLPAFR